MSEVKLVVRDAARTLSLTCHASDAERAVAALSADPETIAELQVAFERFQRLHGQRVWGWALERLDDEPWDAGLVLLDLAARLVVVDTSYFVGSRRGSVTYQNGDYSTNASVGFCLAEDWLLLGDRHGWRTIAEQRRRQRAATPPVDLREILYGTPLLDFIARECWAAWRQLTATTTPPADWGGATHNDPPADAANLLPPSTAAVGDEPAELHEATIRGIHARWLLTPRTDLNSRTPREILLAHRSRLEDDMQQRRDQWARTQQCPRGLDESAHAFRFGGFGTHEIVKYYELVRELLWSCWNRLITSDSSRRTADGVQRFCAEELPRLEQERDEWFGTPDPLCHLRTPRDIIHRERARIPETVSGREAMIDPDCPCCQMLAELPGPTFLHLDGSDMDWDFAFDFYHHTREGWEAEQASLEEFRSSREEWGAPPVSADHRDENSAAPSVWSRSFSMAESSDLPLGVRLLGIAWHVAELVMELNEEAGGRCWVERLHRDLRNLREVLCGESESRIDSLVDPVIERFTQTLDAIAGEHPELEPRCVDLASKVESLRVRPSLTDRLGGS